MFSRVHNLTIACQKSRCTRTGDAAVFWLAFAFAVRLLPSWVCVPGRSVGRLDWRVRGRRAYAARRSMCGTVHARHYDLIVELIP